MAKRHKWDFRPSTLGWYLREAEWFPVEPPESESHPRWMREDGKRQYTASEACVGNSVGGYA